MSSEDKKYVKATIQAVLRGEDGQLLDIQWWDSEESDFSNVVELPEHKLEPPELYKDAENKRIADFNHIIEEDLLWEYYEIKLYELEYPEGFEKPVPEEPELVEGEEVVVPAEVEEIEPFIPPEGTSYKEVFRAVTLKRDRLVDVTKGIVREGDYVATVRGLLYSNLSAEDVELLGATSVAVEPEDLTPSAESDYSNVLEEIGEPLDPPELIEKEDTSWWVDWTDHLDADLRWDNYRVRLYEVVYPEFELPEDFDEETDDISEYLPDPEYEEVYSTVTTKEPRRLNVTLAILDIGEGEYVATLQGVVDGDLSEEEVAILEAIEEDDELEEGAGEPEEVSPPDIIYEMEMSSAESDYSNSLIEEYEQADPPELCDLEDIWTVRWQHESFKWDYVEIKVFRADVPEESLPKGPFDQEEVAEEVEIYDPFELPEDEGDESEETSEDIEFIEVHTSDILRNSEENMPYNITEVVTEHEAPGTFYATIRGITAREAGKPNVEDDDSDSPTQDTEDTSEDKQGDNPLDVEVAYDDYTRPSRESEPSNEIDEELLQLDPPDLHIFDDLNEKKRVWRIGWDVAEVANQEVLIKLYHAEQTYSKEYVDGELVEVPNLIEPEEFELVGEYEVANSTDNSPLDVTEDVWEKGVGVYVSTIAGLGNRDLASDKPSWQQEELLHRDARRTTVESLFSAEVEAIPQELGYDDATLLTDYMTCNNYELIFAVEGIAPIDDEYMIGNVPRRVEFTIERLRKLDVREDDDLGAVEREVMETFETSNPAHKISYSHDQVKFMSATNGILYDGGAVFLRLPIQAGAVDDFELRLNIRSKKEVV